jgi:endonuclease-3 related protein
METFMNLTLIYLKLLKSFGKQNWWPADSKFEILLGAILTQQTTWRNVEAVIRKLKMKGLLTPHSLASTPVEEVERLIRQTGFFRQKAQRLLNISKYLLTTYQGSMEALFDQPTTSLRTELLSLKGVGLETADSIMLYAGDKLTFPIDAYTLRICRRLGVKERKYERIKKTFEEQLPRDLEIYKELHALLDKLGKTYCRSKPQCIPCPLASICDYQMVGS